jgi:hypothetical protein
VFFAPARYAPNKTQPPPHTSRGVYPRGHLCALRSVRVLLLNCRHYMLLFPTSPPIPLSPSPDPRPPRYIRASLYRFSQLKTHAFSPRNTAIRAPRHLQEGTHTSKTKLTVPAPLNRKPCVFREKYTLSAPIPSVSSCSTGRSSPIHLRHLWLKMLDFLGKYAPHLNSVLSGSSYLQKTPCFPVPNALKTTPPPQKNLPLCTSP